MNNKSKKISVPYLLFMMAIGGICGFLLTSDSIPHPDHLTFKPSIVYDYDVIFGVIGLACFIFSMWSIVGIVQLSSMRNDESNMAEDETPASERAIGSFIQISVYNVIIAFVWFALGFAYFASREARDNDQEAFLIANVLSSVVFVVLAVILQAIILRHYNKLFPDRSINLRSRSAQRELFDKLDEAERFTVYRSAYSSFKAVNHMITGGILFFILYSFLFEFTPLPIIALAIIAIVQKAVYYREANKSNLGR
ncbi:uncharacterized protein DUF3169 [Paenibacillus taihuensis]|uniref:Uncharacterized protein DUF3169 n=1 Tax=Paenibacillus taihuensis TaxID=1156355 RepID=A0A3D9R2B2_9BACL|nr:DUF3169 family protein [Paenibacillus taihuensis]REE68099.1 uncharacterized protein DUF3169 [Paenibacillus taihuensis]